MSGTPALSVQLPSFTATDPGTWQHLLDRALAADEAGVDRVFVSDHVVYGENLEAYARPELGGTEGGKQPTGPDGLWLEPLTVLTTVAAITSQIRLATGILLAALRRPVVLAKTLSTMDVLSGGRLDIGVGVGWQREEYVAAGLSYERRGRQLDHTLEVCQTLWREMRASYSSDELTFDAIHQMPKPLQPGGVPFWVSGTINDRVLARVAKYGSGWIPWGTASNDLEASIRRVHEAVEAAGRKTDGFQVAGTLPIARDDGGTPDMARTMERVPALVAAGVTDFRAHLPIPTERAAATDYLAEWVGAFRAAVGRGRG